MFIEFVRNLTVPEGFGIVATMMVLYSQGLEIWTIFYPDPETGKKTEPSRSASWIWTVAQVMMVAMYLETGEKISAGVGIVYAITFFGTGLLSLRYGYLKRLDALDWISILSAGVTILFWCFSTEPLVILVLAIVTDFLGCIPVIRKAWKDPTSESRMAWAWTTLACFLNLFAVNEWGIESWLYVPYLFAVNGVIAYGVWFSPNAIQARYQRSTE